MELVNDLLPFSKQIIIAVIIIIAFLVFKIVKKLALKAAVVIIVAYLALSGVLFSVASKYFDSCSAKLNQGTKEITRILNSEY
jgi:archaellum component FlaF (FlaF/FlaG flagellin family)